MELNENENVLLECELPENVNKYENKTINLQLLEKSVEAVIYTKKDEKVNDKEKKDDKKDDKDDAIIKNLENNEANEVSENKYVPLKNNKCQSIGVVMYLQKNEYKENNEENKLIHIRDAASPSFLALVIKKIFEELYQTKIKNLIMGHEHGEKNSKCHLQIIINFDKPFRKIMKPGAMKLKYDNQYTCLIFMQQKTRNSHALRNYCLKERDATIVKDDEFTKYEPKEDDNPFIYIRDNYNKITIDEAREKLLQTDPEAYFRNCNNFESAIRKIVVDEPKVPFKWMPIPEYLKDYILANGENFYDVFNTWYQKYCINGENIERKKALCLYSKNRSMGKSYFVRHLVSDPAYILEFNNTFCWKKNMNKGIYKLLLLDDMGSITTTNKAIWKSLVASEPTVLRGAWLNEPFNERLPCIITTNDIEMIKLFRDSKLFNTQVAIIEITKYMGTPGTQREDLMHKDFIITYDTAEKLDKLNTNNVYVNSNNL